MVINSIQKDTVVLIHPSQLPIGSMFVTQKGNLEYIVYEQKAHGALVANHAEMFIWNAANPVKVMHKGNGSIPGSFGNEAEDKVLAATNKIYELYQKSNRKGMALVAQAKE